MNKTATATAKIGETNSLRRTKRFVQIIEIHYFVAQAKKVVPHSR
jgi:hypothetical protein